MLLILQRSSLTAALHDCYQGATPYPARCLSWSPHAEVLVFGGDERVVNVVNPKTGEVLYAQFI